MNRRPHQLCGRTRAERGRRRRYALLSGAIALCALNAGIDPPAANAGAHRDWTTVPLGSFQLQEGKQQITIARPYDYLGVIPAPIVLVALFDPAAGADAPPAELTLSVGAMRYPAWKIRSAGQMYLVGSGLLERDASHNGRAITLDLEVQQALPGLAMMASGSPDLGLAGPTAAGPLELVVNEMPRGEEREYLSAIVSSADVDLAAARAALERLGAVENETVARLARAARRRIEFAMVESKAADSFEANYRLGVYAQQVGLFRSARLHLERALTHDVRQPNAWFRLGEVLERCGEDELSFGPVFERAGMSAGVSPSTWSTLVVTIVGREAAGGSAGSKPLTQDEIKTIQQQWRCFTQTVFGATRGRLHIEPRFIQLDDAAAAGYRALEYRPPGVAGGGEAMTILAPPPSLGGPPGNYDWIVTIRRGGQGATVGPDCGVGAAVSDVPAEVGWSGLLVEFCRLVDVLGAYGETDDLTPTLRHVGGSGSQPAPSLGAVLRAGLGHHAGPESFRDLAATAPPAEMGYVRNWYLSASACSGERAGQPPDSTRPLSESALPGRLEPPADFVASPTDFVDLERYFREKKVDPARQPLAQATAYVLSQKRMPVRLWLLQNDRAAVWLNDTLVHRGDVYPGNAWLDATHAAEAAVPAILLKGWNRIDVVTERAGPPRDRAFGFALRIATDADGPIDGLIQATERTQPPRVRLTDPFIPRAGGVFRWDEVRQDVFGRLPALNAAGLRRFGTLPEDLRIQAVFDRQGGVMVIGAANDAESAASSGIRLRAAPSGWDVGKDRDVQLNNVLDWERESVAVYPYRKNDAWRHLLFVKPEAVDAYLACLRESPDARQAFANTLIASRVLGFLRLGSDENWRHVIVIDALLATPLPLDEEDLLSPG